MRPSLSLQSILSLRFILAAILPLLLFGWFASSYLAERQLESADVALQGHALNIRDEVSEFFNQVQTNLLLVRNSVNRLSVSAPAEIDPLLQEVATQSVYFDAIYLVDERSEIRNLGLSSALAANRPDYLDLDLSGINQLLDQRSVQLNVASDSVPEIAWSDTFVSLASGKPSVMVRLLLAKGYLLGTVNLDRLADYLHRRVRQSEEMVFAVIDHHGTLIAHTDQRLALERNNFLIHPEIKTALTSGRDIASKLHEDGSLMESVRIIPLTGWAVYASLPQRVALQGAERLRTILLSIMAGAAVFGTGLAFWQSRQVLLPLLRLRDGTQGVARGDYRGLGRVQRTGNAELDDLFGNFLEMGAAVMEREASLRAGEERYRSLIAGMGEGLLVVRRDGIVTDCNESAERIFSLTRSELVGAAMPSDQWRMIRENGLPFPTEEHPSRVTLQTGKTISNQVVGLCRPDGREIWLQINSCPQLSPEGEVANAILTFADVTRLKVAEASLRLGKLRYQELFQQFSALLEGITDRIELLGPDLRVVWSNHKDLEMTAADAAPPSDQCCFAVRFGRTEPCPECPVLRCFSSGQRQTREIVDARGRTWSLRAFPVKGEATVSHVVLIAEDISEKVEGDRQRNRSNQLAALGELAAGVAHEINNPISGVINYAQLILNQAEDGSREHELARRIIKEGDRIAVIVRELLTFAREENTEVRIVSLREALAETLALCEAPLRKECVDLHVDLPADLPRVASRSHQIQQLLLNLVSNARHALAEKYPQPHADKILMVSGRKIELDGRSFIRLKVRDHGTGIPPNLLEKVMNPFVTTKPAGVGTGLGLSISYEIAKKHGGSLMLASEYGAWTEVTVDLPAVTSE